MKLARFGALVASVAFVVSTAGTQVASGAASPIGAKPGPKSDGSAASSPARTVGRGQLVHMQLFKTAPHHRPHEGDEEERPPRTPIDPKAHLRHGPPRQQATKAAPEGESAQPSTGTDFSTYVDTSPTGTASLISEPSVASDGPNVMETWNWGAAVSSDGGAHWSYLDPYSDFPASYGGFCCDQVVIYNPTYNLFLWILQYSADGSSNNELRLAVAQGGYNMTHGIFYYYDLTPQQIGSANGTNYDQPKAGMTTSNFWIEVTRYGATGGSVVLKLPLSSIASGSTINYSYWGANLFSPGLVRNEGATMFFAGHVDTDTIRIFHWDDSSGTINWNDINHTAYPQNYPYSCPRTGGSGTSDWCQRRSFGGGWAHSDRIFYGQHVGNTVSFQWDASQGTGGFGTFTYPYVQGIRVDTSTMTKSSEDLVYNQSFAWQYAALSPNAGGYLGGTIMFGGGSTYEGCSTILHDAYTSGSWEADYSYYGAYDTSDTLSGDYLTSGSPSDNTWFGGCYLPESSGSSMTVHYFRFGRVQDSPLRTLSATVSGPGLVYSYPNYEIYCFSSCSHDFVRYTSVALYASPSPGYSFTGWGGACSGYGTTQPCYVYMSSAASVTASFADTTAPKITKAPKVSLIKNSSVASNDVPVKISWAGSDAGSGVQNYRLQESLDGGAYSNLGGLLTTTSKVVSLPAGHAYRFRVRATDNAGNTSGYSAGKTYHLNLYQENNGAIAYTTGWTRIAQSGASGGHVEEASVAGKKATFTFSGIQVGFVTTVASTNGSATIAIDGGSAATVDTHATGGPGIVRYVTATSAGSHTLVLKVLGTAGHPKIDVDAFVVIS